MPSTPDPSIFRLWLGDPSVLGADSWLEVIYLVAGALAVIIAIFQLRKTAMQSRATFLLQLGEKWDSLENPRKEAGIMHDQVRTAILASHARKRDEERLRELRSAYKSYLEDLRTNHKERFTKLSEYWGFHETVGLMVRKRYIPFRDVYLLYKGPLIEIERACTEFVQEWQKEAHIPPGLFENMLRISRRAKRRDRLESTLASLKFWKKDE